MTPTEQAKTMVRRVAEALCDLERDGTDCIRPAAEWSDQQLKAQGYWQIARAAIGAMSEVDDRFFKRVADLAHDGRFSVSGETYPVFRNFMRAMTAAALSEEVE